MKLHEINLFENYSAESGKRLTDKQFDMAYAAVVGKELDKGEIADLAKEFAESEKFGRTKDSAEFVLSRMHILLHGVAPHGETQNRAETMFNIPKTMIDYANRKGYDTFENIKKAKADLKGRPVRVKHDAAKKLMAQYYKENKDKLPKNIAQHRDEIIKDIMAGSKPVEAFAKY